MEERIDLVVLQEPKRRAGGIAMAIVVSAIVHGGLLVLFLLTYRPTAPVADNVPIARYVELIKQNPQKVIEAPGAKVDQAPLNAPLSDANREASIPRPTGDQPTTRPGDGNNFNMPMGSGATRGARVMGREPQEAFQQPPSPSAQQEQPPPLVPDGLVFRDPVTAAAATPVDLRSAIKEIGKVASLGGGAQGLDAGQFGGGEQGFAKEGPLSFESSWYNWGDYAVGMISRLRVNWYANMPHLLRTGITGIVTIRFTIHRDGRITDITTLKSSGHPPYDFAARKAIELSAPLAPLPKDFPNSSERVTCVFYYNLDVP